jgi:hypothetical protein
MSLSIKIDMNEVRKNAEVLRTQIPQKAHDTMEYTMTWAENTAKENAPWTDRTTQARKSINHKTEDFPGYVMGTLYIGVFYGVFLELSNQGKYRIIRPTMDRARTELRNNLKRMMP